MLERKETLSAFGGHLQSAGADNAGVVAQRGPDGLGHGQQIGGVAVLFDGLVQRYHQVVALIADTAAHNNYFGAEGVDNTGNAHAQIVDILSYYGQRGLVTHLGSVEGNLAVDLVHIMVHQFPHFGAKIPLHGPFGLADEGGGGSIGLKAAPVTAAAGFAAVDKGEVAGLGAAAGAAGKDLAVDDQTATDTGAHGDHEGAVVLAAAASQDFAQSGAVGVVAQIDRQLECLAHQLGQRNVLPAQIDGGENDTVRSDGAGDADTYGGDIRHGQAGLSHDGAAGVDHVLDQRFRGPAGAGGNAESLDERAVFLYNADGDIGAADINTEKTTHGKLLQTKIKTSYETFSNVFFESVVVSYKKQRDKPFPLSIITIRSWKCKSEPNGLALNFNREFCILKQQEMTDTALYTSDWRIYMGKREAAAPKKVKKTEQKSAKTKPAKNQKQAADAGTINKKGLIAILALLLVLVGLYVFLCSRVAPDRYLTNTVIDGVDISGKTVQQADEALMARFDERWSDAQVKIALDGTDYAVELWNQEHTILWADTQQVLEEAMERSNGHFLTRGFQWIAAQVKGWEGESVLSIHAGEELKAAVAETGLFEVNTAVETSYSIGEQSITIHKGEAGEVADADTVVSQIGQLVSSGAWPETQRLDCATLTSDIAALDVEKIYNEVYAEAADATLDPANDYAIVPSVVGVSFDLEAAKQALADAQPGSQVDVPLIITQPEISTEDMEANLFKDVLGSYTTTVSGSSGRRENVRLSASFCDGTILLVGDVFSYNDVVGQRTKARGFSEADAYLNGQTIKQVGGGICQTSSTLYAACLYSNLEIVTRTNHSFASSYIGLGLDATVSWGGPEFKFANNTKYPIKVVGEYANGKVTMKILGTKTDDITVKIVSKTLEKIPFSVKYEKDSSMYVGEEKTITTAYTGYKVQTYRELYDGNGSLISSTEEAYSYYKKRDKVIAQGTKEKPSSNNNNSDGDNSGDGE